MATRTVGRGREAREFRNPKGDAVTALAVFDGTPMLIVTDASPIGGKVSGWNNPILVGSPDRIEYFNSPKE